MTKRITPESVKSWEHRVGMFEADALKLFGSLHEDVAESSKSTVRRSSKPRVVIGHGRSPVWLVLKDFLRDRLGFVCDEFNHESSAGIPISTRLESMADQAEMAFVIMTAEDLAETGEIRARENVVHEVGYFQGKLGFEKAIVLLEHGCNEFSNIHGLGQIRFPKDDVLAKSEEIRKVLEREGLIR